MTEYKMDHQKQIQATVSAPDAPAATRIIECRLPGERASLVHPFGRHGHEAT